LLIQGDNLVALKALLPYYAGQVKCIYIDPPYNTGNEKWEYNDAVNSPEMREWLGNVVKGEMEDLSRHDKWLCMMYPRLTLLRELLSEDGAIFISIDDNEIGHLRLLMNEIFGANNFVTTIIWQKIYTIKNSARHFSEMHDYVIVYAFNKNKWIRNLLPRTEEHDKDYQNPDNDPHGPWISNALQSRNYYSKGIYSITCPSGRIIKGPPAGTYWRLSEENFWELAKTGKVWWGAGGNGIPRIKRYKKDAKQGVVPSTIWFYKEVGTNSDAKTYLRRIIGDVEMFTTPKPVELIKRILQISTDKDSLILDSFAGTGTTAHATISLNHEDEGSRRFILVEMDAHVSQNITAERIRRALKGYTYTNSQDKSTKIEGFGGGFTYCRIGDSLFDEKGNIRPKVKFADLAAHIFFTETGGPLPTGVIEDDPLLGSYNGIAIYLLYNGILGDKRPQGGNVLTRAVLAGLPPHDGPKVIYGTSCRIGVERLKRENIIFRQIPYAVKED
jgi:site-specific DNA-methyltransferase (adenine-specific)/adenine-specific DNA-methyltransferase